MYVACHVRLASFPSLLFFSLLLLFLSSFRLPLLPPSPHPPLFLFFLLRFSLAFLLFSFPFSSSFLSCFLFLLFSTFSLLLLFLLFLVLWLFLFFVFFFFLCRQFLPFILGFFYRLFLCLGLFFPPHPLFSCSSFSFFASCLPFGDQLFLLSLPICLFFCSCTQWSCFSLLSLSLLLSMFLQYFIRFSYLGFSLSVSPSASLPPACIPPPRRLYSYALRLSSASGSLSLVSTCSPSFPLPFLRWLLLLLSSFFLPLRPLSFSFCFGLSLSLSLSRKFSFSCLFSVVGNAVQGCLCSVLFRFSSSLLMLRLRFLCAGGRWGSPMFFVWCASHRGSPLFVFSSLRGVLLFLFRFAFDVSLPFGLGLALSVTSVSSTCFRLSFSLLYAPALFSLRRRRGGGVLCCLFSVNQNGILRCFSLPTSGVFFLFLFFLLR